MAICFKKNLAKEKNKESTSKCNITNNVCKTRTLA